MTRRCRVVKASLDTPLKRPGGCIASWPKIGHCANSGERKLEGGESFLDIRNRFVPFIEQLVRESAYADQNILLLGHGGTFRMLLPLILSNVDQAFVKAHLLDYTTYVVAEQREDRLQWGDITFS